MIWKYLEKKSHVIPKGFELGHRWVSRIGLYTIFPNQFPLINEAGFDQMEIISSNIIIF